MTYRRHQVAIDYINILMQFIIAYLTMALLLYPFDTKSPLLTLALLPAPYISYWIKRYTRHIWSFTLLHLILAAIYLLSNRLFYYVIVNAFYLVVLAAYSYYSKHKLQDRANSSPFLLVYILMIYATCHLIKYEKLLPLCFWLAVSFTLLYILNMYLLNLDRFVRNHEHIVNVPFDQIKNINHILTAFLCFLFLLSMVCFSRLPHENLLAILGTLLINVLRFLLSRLNRPIPDEAVSFEEEELPSPEELPHGVPSKLIQILASILQWTITIAVIICAVVLILYTIYRIYQHFYRKEEDIIKDEVHFISPFDKKEKLRKEPKPFHLIFHLPGKSNNIVIRRHFAKAVLANAGPERKLLDSLTPSELSEYVVGQKDDQSSDEMERILVTNCYEKARYSNQVCTREEVQYIRKIAKRR